MPTCHICGRATILDRGESDHYASFFNICSRAGCEPERRHHEKAMNAVKGEFWPIAWRFEKKAAAARANA